MLDWVSTPSPRRDEEVAWRVAATACIFDAVVARRRRPLVARLSPPARAGGRPAVRAIDAKVWD